MVGGYLRQNGFEVSTAPTLSSGRVLLRQASFDALLLDLMLPDGDGLDFTRELRGEPRTRRLPLLMLTARGEPMDRIVGLELGADDYLPKPFEPRELLARVKALLRRAAPDAAQDEVLRFGRLEVDLGARQARLAGQVCDLTSHQFELLTVLARSPGRVLTRDQIMDALKGHPLEAFDSIVDQGLSSQRMGVKFLFKPGTAAMWTQPGSGPVPYTLWLTEIAARAAKRDVCMDVVGHTSATGAEPINERLSLQRAETVKREIARRAPKLQKQLTSAGAGSREMLVGSGRDDLSDALDRRVEFKVKGC